MAKHGIYHLVLDFYKMCTNNDPGITVTYLRQDKIPLPYIGEKGLDCRFLRKH